MNHFGLKANRISQSIPAMMMSLLLFLLVPLASVIAVDVLTRTTYNVLSGVEQAYEFESEPYYGKTIGSHIHLFVPQILT